MASQVPRQIKQVVGDNLKAARKRKGLKLRELGDLVGKTEAHVWRWENGKHKPTDATLMELARVLDVSYADFFTDLEQAA
jgi:transcriptional regulator with XRE-family HTH domain